MRKCIKYALVFTGGVAVGVGVCGANLISYALSDEDIREGIKNKISRKIDKTLYGDESNHKKYSSVSYRSYYNKNYNTQNCFSFSADDIIFESRNKAQGVLDDMEDIIDKYNYVTVADMRDLSGLINTTYRAAKYGWASLKKAEIRRVRDGYIIDLPAPVIID